MSQRGRRRRIAPNIWEDDRRRIGIAKVGQHRTSKRFPKSTSERTIQAWIEDTRRDLRRRRAQVRRQKGTLTGDIRTFLATLPPKTPATRNTASYLATWLIALGDVKRSTLTDAKLQRVVHEWIAAGVAASSIKHRRRALAQLIETLDGPDAPNPARVLKTPREPDAAPRRVDMAVLTTIIDGMDQQRTVRHSGRRGKGFRNRAHARLRMLLWTGIAPATLQRLRAHDIDLDKETITVPARLKGRGAPAVTLPLFPDGVESCRRWLRASAWGSFDQRVLGRAFHTAVERYVAKETAAGRTVTLPPDLRPYDLRHSFLSWLWETTEDILLVQHYAQHADLKTTSRYTRGAVDRRIRDVVDRIRKKSA